MENPENKGDRSTDDPFLVQALMDMVWPMGS